MFNITNIKSEPVPNNALVLMDFESFKTITEVILKYISSDAF